MKAESSIRTTSFEPHLTNNRNSDLIRESSAISGTPGTKGAGLLITIRNVANTIFARLSDCLSKISGSKPIKIQDRFILKEPSSMASSPMEESNLEANSELKDGDEVEGFLSADPSLESKADGLVQDIYKSNEETNNFIVATQRKSGEFISRTYIGKFIELVIQTKKSENYANFTEKKESSNSVRINQAGVLSEIKPSTMFQKDVPIGGITLYPYVFTGGRFGVDHIVLVAIDHNKKEIMYYDPQGLTSDDPTRRTKEIDMHEELKALGTQCFKGSYTLKEINVPHQKDSHSCGVYVSTAMKQLSEGKSFEEAMKHCAETPVKQLRRALTDGLIEKTVR